MTWGKVSVTFFTVYVLAASAFGWGNLVSSFDVPFGNTYPFGLAYAHTSGYVEYLFFTVNNTTVDYCFRTALDGFPVKIHNSPTYFSMGCAAGFIRHAGYYWVVSYNPRMIYQIGYNSGSIYHSFAAPGNYPYGAAFRHTGFIPYLYHTDRVGKKLYRMHATTGSVYASYSLSFAPGDCAYDTGGYIWITEPSARVVRKCMLTGSAIDSFSVAAYGYPGGCAFDGTYVWVGIGYPLHRIMQFEVAGSSGSYVGPPLFVKIKSVFS
jgi:hypothetical protein